MLPTRHWGKLFDFHSSLPLLFAVAALLAPHSPETWLDLEGWSISWRRCQSSQSPRALMAALSSRFKFTSPRMRPGSTYKIHTSSRVHLKTTFDMKFISARTWSGSSRPWYDIWIQYDMKTLTETFIWGHKLLPKYMHLSKYSLSKFFLSNSWWDMRWEEIERGRHVAPHEQQPKNNDSTYRWRLSKQIHMFPYAILSLRKTSRHLNLY